jgi:hypothetical protein
MRIMTATGTTTGASAVGFKGQARTSLKLYPPIRAKASSNSPKLQSIRHHLTQEQLKPEMIETCSDIFNPSGKAMPIHATGIVPQLTIDPRKLPMGASGRGTSHLVANHGAHHPMRPDTSQFTTNGDPQMIPGHQHEDLKYSQSYQTEKLGKCGTFCGIFGKSS